MSLYVMSAPGLRNSSASMKATVQFIREAFFFVVTVPAVVVLGLFVLLMGSPDESD